MKQKIIIIMGPTAVGKTDLALGIAKKYNGAIISADSMQVYKHLNIGTAKESKEQMQSVPHYLIDILEPHQLWNAGSFKESAENILVQLKANNKLPIIAGGTGLYVKSLIYPYTFSNSESNQLIRDKYERLAKEYGNEYVYNILKEIDIESANKLHYNELKRVIRAIEIYETTGTKKSAQANEEKINSKYDPLIIVLTRGREELYSRINLRVDKMFQQGLLEEAKQIYDNKQFNRLSSEAIGYKQLISYFNGEISLQYAMEKIKQLSRNYAKRQITYFKSFPNAYWFNPETQSDEIYNLINNFLSKN